MAVVRNVLKKQLAEENDVQIGDRVAIRFLGEKEGKSGNNYFGYKTAVAQQGPRNPAKRFTLEPADDPGPDGRATGETEEARVLMMRPAKCCSDAGGSLAGLPLMPGRQAAGDPFRRGLRDARPGPDLGVVGEDPRPATSGSGPGTAWSSWTWTSPTRPVRLRELASYAGDRRGGSRTGLDTFTVSHAARRDAPVLRGPRRTSGTGSPMLPGVDVRGQPATSWPRITDGSTKRYLPETYRETVSIGADGIEILEAFVAGMSRLPQWLVDLIAKPKPAADRRAVPDVEIREASSYLEAVLLGERHRLMLAKPGERNHALNVAAYRLGKHVAADRLSYEEAESWLIATAGQVFG